MLDKQKIEELKQQAGLSAYKRRLALEKVGREYKVKCAFHGDRNPSLAVYKKEGTWLWWCMSHPEACGGGDIISLIRKLQQREGKDDSFEAAVSQLAEETGVAIGGQKGSFDFDVQEAAAHLKKADHLGMEALAYLSTRGISVDVARKADIGVMMYPGLGTAISIPYENGGAKFRIGNPKEKHDKFRHLLHKPTAEELYGLEFTLVNSNFTLNPEVWVVESELDCLTLRSHRLNAVSVSSATTCLNYDGSLKIPPAQLKRLEQNAEQIFLAMDMDEAGEKCAGAFERALHSNKTFRIKWTYAGRDSGDPKDIGELYTVTKDGFAQRLEELKVEAINRPPKWRELFHAPEEMEQGTMKFLVRDFLPEGVTFIGGLSATGKTWFALSLAKALTTGKKFLGRFEVPEMIEVLYLIPESGERAFRARLDKMGIKDRFLCRTMKDGLPLRLDDPLLLQAVQTLKPVIFLDTAIRFSDAESENDAKANARGLANDIFELQRSGARAVVGIHHAPKTAANKELTLENTLRGTGDLGAMCDSVYGLQCVKSDVLQVKVKCVKPRDFEPVPPFHIQGRPYIDETGDFGLLVDPKTIDQVSQMKELVAAIQANPQATYRDLSEVTGIALSLIRERTEMMGYAKTKEGWRRSTSSTQVELELVQ